MTELSDMALARAQLTRKCFRESGDFLLWVISKVASDQQLLMIWGIVKSRVW